MYIVFPIRFNPLQWCNGYLARLPRWRPRFDFHWRKYFFVFNLIFPIFYSFCNKSLVAFYIKFNALAKRSHQPLFFIYIYIYTFSNPNSIITVENNIQSDFNDSKQWSKNNKMYVHDTKTSCMAVGTRQRLDGSHHLDLKSGDVRIKHVSNQKKGIYIEENLNWTTHIFAKLSHLKSHYYDSYLSMSQYMSRNNSIRVTFFLWLIMAPSLGDQRLLQMSIDYQNFKSSACNSQIWLRHSISYYVSGARLDVCGE